MKFLLIFLLFVASAEAKTFKLTWDQKITTETIGYRLYLVKNSVQTKLGPDIIYPNNTATVSKPNGTYIFQVTSFSLTDESKPSKQLKVKVTKTGVKQI